MPLESGRLFNGKGIGKRGKNRKKDAGIPRTSVAATAVKSHFFAGHPPALILSKVKSQSGWPRS